MKTRKELVNETKSVFNRRSSRVGWSSCKSCRGDAEEQQSTIIDLAPKRGDILDRDGRPLAYNVDAESSAANPREVADPLKFVNQLCRALPLTKFTLGRTLPNGISLESRTGAAINQSSSFMNLRVRFRLDTN